MILKGSQRAGGQALAAHLMRTDDNEHVEIHEIRGFVGNDLASAFKEAEAVSRGTRCQKFLFSLSLSPPQTESVPVEAFEAAISKIEQKLRLSGQPRVVVFHEKEGRRHAHCVWSRIDGEEMKARALPHFKLKLRDISRELYLEHNWTLPRGLESPALRDPLNFDLVEWQQAKRIGADPREIKGVLQDCWAVSDSKESFQHALNERGFYLACGDRRGFVVLDYHGEAYSLTRTLALKKREIQARVGDPKTLKGIAETKALIAKRMTPKLKQHISDSRKAFNRHSATLRHAKDAIRKKHCDSRTELRARQAARQSEENKARASRFRKGVKGLWDRVTGQHKRIRKLNEREANACKERDRGERQRLVSTQLSERRLLQKKITAVRHRQSLLLRELRRDVGRYLQYRSNSIEAETRSRERHRRRDFQ